MAKSAGPVEGRLIVAVQAKQEGKAQSQLANRPLDSDVVDWVDTQAASLNYAIGRPGIPVGRLTVLVGKEKSGKALDLETPIPTPLGWKRFGDLVAGDPVFDENGASCRVSWIGPTQDDRPCYEILFSDHTTITADEQHEWLTRSYPERAVHHERGARRRRTERRVLAGSHDPRLGHSFPRIHDPAGRIRTTVEIADSLKTSRGRDWNHHVPLCAPVEYPTTELPIPPYTLGAWLGDGSRASGRITKGDDELWKNIAADGFEIGAASPSAPLTKTVYGLVPELRALGVLNNKHIPPPYLRSSVDQRLALLRGLMDTDGTVSPRSQCTFDTTIEALAWQVLELVRSLGFRAALRSDRAILYGKDCGPAFRVDFAASSDLPVFTLPRKRDRLRNYRKRPGKAIVDVFPVRSRPVRCIEVDSPSHLYLAGPAFTPTHNSSVAYHLLQETQRRGGVAILVDAERRYSRDRAERIGIDHDRLIYMPGETVESTFKELYTFVEVVRDELPDQLVTIAWDSLAGTPTEANLKGDILPGQHARLVGHWFRVLLPLVAHKRITFVMVNQLRTKIDMGGGTYFSGGSSDAMIAERALDYHCSLKIHFTQIAKLGDPKKPTGITTRADVKWNTVAPPFHKELIHINFLDGIDKDACAFEVAKDLRLVKQSTSWWEYPGHPKFQGGHTKKWSEILSGDEELQRSIAAAPLGWQP